MDRPGVGQLPPLPPLRLVNLEGDHPLRPRPHGGRSADPKAGRPHFRVQAAPQLGGELLHGGGLHRREHRANADAVRIWRGSPGPEALRLDDRGPAGERQSDGTWFLDRIHPDEGPGSARGAVRKKVRPLALERAGEPSKWITLTALRVLKRVEDAS